MDRLTVALLAFDGMTLQDVVGPQEVLSACSGIDVRYVGAGPTPYRNDRRQLRVECDMTLEESIGSTDVLIVGGGNMYPLLRDPAFVDTLARACSAATWVCSVCTGSEFLGAIGWLRGRRATTLWPFVDDLVRYGAIPVRERWVVDGNVLTTAGVSAGLDGALWLAGELVGRDAAEAAQLAIEYAPRPPFDAGDPVSAPPHVVRALEERYHRLLAEMRGAAGT